MNGNDFTRLDYLLELVDRDEADASEYRELKALLDGEGGAAILERIHAFHSSRAASSSYDPSDWQAVVKAILAVDRTAAVPTLPFLRRRFWWVAASILLILVGAGAYWLGSHNRHEPIAFGRPQKQDAPPGGNRAILTLGGGRKIVLDSAANGLIAREGTANIQLANNGHLTYRPDPAHPGPALYNILTTPRGGQYRLQLPDGTRVWLNAASSIRYPTAFTGKQRVVEITGEAYFEVARDPSLPFRVESGSLEIQVLGTNFNINAYEDEPISKTTLLSGSIKLIRGDNHVLLTPGQQAQFNGRGALVSVNPADTAQTIAWKNGFTSFTNAGLHEIMRQISRWYDVDIIYEGNIPERNFTGEVSRNSDLSKLLKILTASGIHFRIEGKRLTVLP